MTQYFEGKLFQSQAKFTGLTSSLLRLIRKQVCLLSGQGIFLVIFAISKFCTSSVFSSTLKFEKKKELAKTKQCPDLRIPDISESIAGEFDFSWKLSCLEYVAYLYFNKELNCYISLIFYFYWRKEILIKFIVLVFSPCHNNSRLNFCKITNYPSQNFYPFLLK